MRSPRSCWARRIAFRPHVANERHLFAEPRPPGLQRFLLERPVRRVHPRLRTARGLPQKVAGRSRRGSALLPGGPDQPRPPTPDRQTPNRCQGHPLAPVYRGKTPLNAGVKSNPEALRVEEGAGPTRSRQRARCSPVRLSHPRGSLTADRVNGYADIRGVQLVDAGCGVSGGRPACGRPDRCHC